MLVFIAFFAYLTVRTMIDHGVSGLGNKVLDGGSLLVLALFAVGIVGALLHPPDE